MSDLFLLTKIISTFVKITFVKMNKRLEQFLAAENISQSKFADTIDVARASVSHILAGRNNPGYDFIVNTLRHYPALNAEWLLTGKGKMYKQSSVDTDTKESSLTEKDTASTSYNRSNQGDDDNLFSIQDSENIAVLDSPSASDSPSPENGQASDPSKIVRESPISGHSTTLQPNIEFTAGMQKAHLGTESPVNQRKIVKIIAFYDDNTFQELH